MGTYTTAAKVASLLQIPAFDGSTTPTSTEVEEIISRMEDRFDSRTGHAWRTVTVTDEYLRPSTNYRRGTGIRFDLSHRDITTFSSGTDKFEIWDGSSWVEYVANKTEGRANDFWVDYVNGVIFLVDRTSLFEHGVRATYRYGTSTVPGGVEDAVTKMAAIDVLNAHEDLLVFPDDGSTNKPTHRERIEKWQKDIDTIIGTLMEWDVI